jgi:hypothetical protein
MVDLRTFQPSSNTATDAQIAAEPVDISWGRGQALCTQKNIQPFYLDYDDVTSIVTANEIQLVIRDFAGIEDELEDDDHPTTLSDEHLYNLRNAGWESGDVTQYNTDESQYPARQQHYISGLIRALTASTSYDEDGVRSFSSTKLAAEPFGTAPAPGGHFKLDPFDTTATNGGGAFPIETWIIGGTTGGVQTITATVTGHPFAATETVTIYGQQSQLTYDYGDPGFPSLHTFPWSFDGAYDITATTVNTFDFDIVFPEDFDSWANQYEQLGNVVSSVTNPNGVVTTVRPTTNAYFAGRAWYAGTPGGVLGQTVYFSQIIRTSKQYGLCHQVADPTSELVPDLVESDGGELFIPEAGRILKLQPFGQSMLVFSANGVWEIDGGSNRYFDAIDYSIRRVTGSGCISGESVIEAEDNIIYASEEGAYRIFVDPEARVLVAENFTREKVQSKWAEIDSIHKSSMKTLFDPVKKRILFMYDTSASPTVRTWNYREVLLYDARLDAWYKYSFSDPTDFAIATYVKGFTKPDQYAASGEATIKVLSFVTAAGLDWNEFSDDTTFEDFAELDAPAYLVTGYESMGDHSKDKQVRYITTFMSRIEDSSLSFRGRWDFADADISGKWAPSVEAYRPPRLWVGAHGADGYPVVTSKHTLPGQGQVLSLRFDTKDGADAVLYGWTIDFQGIQD